MRLDTIEQLAAQRATAAMQITSGFNEICLNLRVAFLLFSSGGGGPPQFTTGHHGSRRVRPAHSGQVSSKTSVSAGVSMAICSDQVDTYDPP